MPQSWLVELSGRLNQQLLDGKCHYALLAPAFYEPSDPEYRRAGKPGVAYIRRQQRVSVFAIPGDRLVTTIELPEAGLKKHPTWLRKFVRQRQTALTDGVHSIVLDIAPNTPAAPQGIHPVLWEPYATADLPAFPGRPLTLTSYAAGSEPAAYLEPLGVGSSLPDMPLFIAPDVYVMLPLEATYHAAWLGLPDHLRPTLDPPTG